MRCCLVAASEFNETDFNRRWKSDQFDSIIAVDGGFSHLQVVDCMPDMLIGDFDSLGYVPAGENVILHPVHKDKSDLELAFDYVLEQHFDEVVVYGALGGRTDHTVGNLQLGARFAETGLALLFVGIDSCVKILVGPATYAIPTLSQGTVSVFSATEVSRCVTEVGLEYPLDAADLTNRTTLGLSNELQGERASVSVEEGTLYIFHPVAV